MAEEDEQSCEDRPESINIEPIAAKDTEMGEEKPREDNEEVDEEELEGDEQEEDGDGQTEDSEDEDEDEEQDKKLQHSLVDESNDGRKESHVEVSFIMNSDMNIDSTVDAVEDDRDLRAGNASSDMVDDDSEEPVASLNCGLISTQQLAFNDEKGSTRHKTEEDVCVKAEVRDSLNHQNVDDETVSRLHTRSSPKAQPSPSKLEHKKEGVRNRTKIESGRAVVEDRNSSTLFMFDTDTSGGGDSGTEEEQAAFIIELRKFYKGRGLDFRPPKFYGVPLNLLKLWRAVLKLGGYDKVTACKDWRQVGESFNPPKTCTTISWTFRIFYEKALVDYERFRTSTDGTSLPGLSVPMGDESQDKSSMPLSKKEKPLKSIGGILKRTEPSSTDDAVKSVQMKFPKIHSDATVIDIGSPADWVKINVQATRDCYEVYALVPGLLREEVRVQSDPAGRLVISGEPENPDNPWNVTPFKKVVSLPSRIDPHQTSAVVTLHGQLFVRVPFEHYD